MKKLLSLLTFCLCYACNHAQDLNFSQFYALPLLRNPALCGIFDGDIRVQAVYRNQWQSVTVPYRSGGLSFEKKFSCRESESYPTIGVQTTYDIAGDSRLSRLQVLPVFSWHQNLSGVEGAYLTGSIMAGLTSSQFDPSRLKWDDQYLNGNYSPTNPTNQVIKNSATNYFDQGVGFSITSPFGGESASGGLSSFYIGGALYHFLKPSVSFNATNAASTRLKEKYVINGGLELPANNGNQFNIFADYLFQGGHRQLMAGLFYTMDLTPQYTNDDALDKSSISIGGAYRWNDALVPIIRIDNRQFSFGLSYDMNVSKLKTASQSRGGFEFTLGFKSMGNCNKPMPCPKF